MKTKTFLPSLLIASLCIGISIAAFSGEPDQGKSGKLQVRYDASLHNLVTSWRNGYISQFPDATIQLSEIKASETGSAIYGGEGITILSSGMMSGRQSPGTMQIVAGREVLVPVMNSANPLLDKIKQTGLSAAALSRLLSDPAEGKWNTLAGDGQVLPVSFYRTDDAAIDKSLARFTGTAGLRQAGQEVADGAALLNAVNSDPAGFGFCRLSDLQGLHASNNISRITIVPVDRNGNGRIDFMEDVSGNPTDLIRGVWIGKYPKALSSAVYIVSSMQPGSAGGNAFSEWVLSPAGQSLLEGTGYSALDPGEGQSQLNALTQKAPIVARPSDASRSLLPAILLVVSLFIGGAFVLEIMGRYFRSVKRPGNASPAIRTGVFDEKSVHSPEGLLYDRSHTWAFMERDGLVRVGIDDFLRHVTGPLTRIEMNIEGHHIHRGGQLATLIQKGKRINVLSPVSGTIIRINKSLAADPTLMNREACDGGWVYAVKPDNWPKEIGSLNMAESYRTWLKGEFVRLRDFFAVTLGKMPGYSGVVLQDGGALRDDLLSEFGPEVWEEFQTSFLRINR